MPNIQYTISAKQTAGSAEVRARFYVGAINQRAATGIFVPVSHWNASEGRCVINRRYETPANMQARKAQQQLDDLTEFIYDRYKRDALNISEGWLRGVLAEFHNPQQKTPPLHELIEEYCDARNVAPATRQKMQTLGGLLRQFAAVYRPLYAATLTRRDIERFSAFLMYDTDGTQLRAQNSVAGRIRQLRTLVYWVGKPYPNPFDEYTIPAEVYGTPVYLTKDERDYLYLYNDFTKRKRVQRDIFIFQCHTGCRVSDLYALTPANITADNWLVYVPKKTAREKATTVEVPLSDTALEIIARYRNADSRGRLFPFISEQQYNNAIMEICRQADLTRPVMVLDPRTFETRPMPLWTQVSSHTARKTFTQIVYSETTDKRLVASMTGHSENSRAFNRYSEITRQMKAAAVFGGNLAKSSINNSNSTPPPTI